MGLCICTWSAQRCHARRFSRWKEDLHIKLDASLQQSSTLWPNTWFVLAVSEYSMFPYSRNTLVLQGYPWFLNFWSLGLLKFLVLGASHRLTLMQISKSDPWVLIWCCFFLTIVLLLLLLCLCRFCSLCIFSIVNEQNKTHTPKTNKHETKTQKRK